MSDQAGNGNNSQGEAAKPESQETDEGTPTMVGQIPASAGLFGAHPHPGAPAGASGSPDADREREEAEARAKEG